MWDHMKISGDLRFSIVTCFPCDCLVFSASSLSSSLSSCVFHVFLAVSVSESPSPSGTPTSRKLSQFILTFFLKPSISVIPIVLLPEPFQALTSLLYQVQRHDQLEDLKGNPGRVRPQAPTPETKVRPTQHLRFQLTCDEAKMVSCVINLAIMI